MLPGERPFAHCRFPAMFLWVCMPVSRRESVTGTSEFGGDVTDRKNPERRPEGPRAHAATRGESARERNESSFPRP